MDALNKLVSLKTHEKQLNCNESVALLFPPSKFQKGLTYNFLIYFVSMGICGDQTTYLKVIFWNFCKI